MDNKAQIFFTLVLLYLCMSFLLVYIRHTLVVYLVPEESQELWLRRSRRSIYVTFFMSVAFVEFGHSEPAVILNSALAAYVVCLFIYLLRADWESEGEDRKYVSVMFKDRP
jgi:hypothetical protein